ncbi:SLAM family member 5 [Oryzias latipes]
MAACRPLCLSYFSSSVLLLLWLCHPGLVSLKTIYKKVGDSVEISSELPTEGVDKARWKYENQDVADRRRNITNHKFGNRLNFNTTTLSLTLTKLTLQDSGNFSFISQQNNKQRKTVVVTLQVYESITEDPILTSTHVFSDSNQFCTVLVTCSLKSTNNVHYELIVGNQTYDGSSLQQNIRKQGEGQKFTCTASNYVSNRTGSITATCPDYLTGEVSHAQLNLLVIGAAFKAGLLIIIPVVLVACCCKQKQEGSNSTEYCVPDVTDHHGAEEE